MQAQVIIVIRTQKYSQPHNKGKAMGAMFAHQKIGAIHRRSSYPFDHMHHAEMVLKEEKNANGARMGTDDMG